MVAGEGDLPRVVLRAVVETERADHAIQLRGVVQRAAVQRDLLGLIQNLTQVRRGPLHPILEFNIDTKNSDQRLKIVRLYLQSERIADARAELEQLIGVDGDRVSFLSGEASAGVDMNRDGDRADSIVGMYEMSTGRLFNFGAGATSAMVSGNFMIYNASEPQNELDYNSDGDQLDTVIQVQQLF